MPSWISLSAILFEFVSIGSFVCLARDWRGWCALRRDEGCSGKVVTLRVWGFIPCSSAKQIHAMTSVEPAHTGNGDHDQLFTKIRYV